MQKIFMDEALSHRLIKSADELAAVSSVNDPESAAAIDALLEGELADLRDVICPDPRQHATLIAGLPFPAVNGPTLLHGKNAVARSARGDSCLP